MTSKSTSLQDLRRRFRGELALSLVTLTWGTTFITTQDVMAVWPPMALLTLRFGVAFLCFAPLLLKYKASRRAIGQGAVLGFFICAGYGLQNLGLVYTTAARTAFAAALVTVFVPLFALVALRIRWAAGTYFACTAAGLGIYLLMGRELGPGVRLGDFLSVGSAAAVAIQVMLLGHFTRRPGVQMVPMLVSQLGTTTALAAVASAAMGETLPTPLFQCVPAILYLGVITTALCLLAQMYGQARTTPTRAAFIYALEPISAAAFAWLLHGQRLTNVEWVGGTLIVLAAVTADQALPPRLRFRRRGRAESVLEPLTHVHTHPSPHESDAPPPPHPMQMERSAAG